MCHQEHRERILGGGAAWTESKALTGYLYLVGEEKGTGTGKRMVKCFGVQHIGRYSKGFGSSEWDVVVVRCGW